jgi:L-malate glycosyltransferase
LVYKKSSFAFPITAEVSEVLRHKGFNKELAICALSLDPELYRPYGKADDEKLIPRAADETVIGYVGRLVEAKGLRTLALALGKIKDLSWKFVVIGKGDYETEFRRLLSEQGVLDRVSFLGYVPHTETPRYLSAFDLLVVPSETQPNWKEQFGRVIPEALASGTTVVGSDSGEIPRLITQSQGGLVFPERNPEEFGERLRKLATSPKLRKQYAQKGMEWVTSHISLRAVSEKMAETLNAATKPRK